MTTQKRSALGRGLGALIPGASSARSVDAQPAPAPPPSAANPVELPIDRIRPNPEQPRRRFDPVEIERLADSIRRHGVLQPVVVRAVEDGYELVVGERRWRASQVAGRTTLPAVVADVAPRDRLEIALVENVQRHDLNPIELALAFQTLAESGATQEQIGERVGFERSTIANHLRLLDLPREMQGDVEDGALSVGHAKAILGVASPERRRSLRDRVVARRSLGPPDGGGRARPRRAVARARQVARCRAGGGPRSREPRRHPARPRADPGPAARQCQSRPHRDRLRRGRRADTAGRPDPGRAVSDAIVDSETPAAGQSHVVVGPTGSFDGLLAFWGLARVEGRVHGQVAAEGTLEVGPEAVVHARIEVDALIVEGLVEGEVVARERVEVRPGGRVTASVATPRLILAEGGSLEGRLVMTGARAAAAPADAASASAA